MMYFTYHDLIKTDQIAYPNRVGGGNFNVEI